MPSELPAGYVGLYDTSGLPIYHGEPVHEPGGGPLVRQDVPDDDEPPGPRTWWYAVIVSRSSLPALLLLQVVLSARLIWTNTAFQDEALYLWAGHLELSHLARHTPVPAFSSYFSGAPVLYPPLGAIADGVGGLVGARLLSLAFMLIATTLLHGMTRRVFGSRTAAFFAAALFVGLGSTSFLGAFATYDAMSFMLLAVAAWLGVRSAGSRPWVRALVLVIVAVLLTLANATKYASALFDPVVIAVVALAITQRRRARAGWLAGIELAAITAGCLVAGYSLSGPGYRHGIQTTTLNRTAGDTAASAVLAMSGRWVGIVIVLAFLGAIAACYAWRRSATSLLAIVLFAAGLLAPLNQARISTSVSLFKHVDFGAWFAAAAAGYFLAALPNAFKRAQGLLLAGGLAVLILAGGLGGRIVSAQYQGWPNSTQLTAELKSLAHPDGKYLIEDSNVESYYLRTVLSPQQVDNTFYFGFTDPKTGTYLSDGPAYAAAIRERYFTAIVLAFGDTAATDKEIVADFGKYGGYRVVATIPYHTAAGPGRYQVWALS